MSSSPAKGRRPIVATMLVAVLAWPRGGLGQEPPGAPAGSVEDRLQRLEALNASLIEQNRALLERLDDLSTKYDEVLRVVGPATGTTPPPPSPSPPTADPDVAPAQQPALPPMPGPSPIGPMGEPASPVSSGSAPEVSGPVAPILPGAIGTGANLGYQTAIIGARGEPAALSSERGASINLPRSGEGKFPLEAFYEDGFVLGSDDEKVPYLLKTNFRLQFRHTGFDRSRLFWVDSAGIVRPITNRNDFEIERGRLTFSGFFYDPKLQFYLNLDADTDDQHTAVAHDFWINYRFGDGLDVYLGKAYVPGSREWLEGSTRTQLVDRSMATTFFRPDRSVGIWALGEPIEKVFYRVMVANGINAANLSFEDLNQHFAYAGSVWSEVIGDFGRGYSDLEWHESPAVRLGNSFTFAPGSPADIAFDPIREQNFVRLSDGTPLFETGALAPGVTVEDFDLYLYAVDAALKYRGLSLNAEYYFRWLQGIQADAPLPVARRQLFDHGFYVQGGYFVVRERVELLARHSQVNGPFGTGQEYALGLNWFINRSHYLKFTFDANWLDAIPAQSTSPNYRAGDSGMLFRTQLQIAF